MTQCYVMLDNLATPPCIRKGICYLRSGKLQFLTSASVRTLRKILNILVVLNTFSSVESFLLSASWSTTLLQSVQHPESADRGCGVVWCGVGVLAAVLPGHCCGSAQRKSLSGRVSLSVVSNFQWRQSVIESHCCVTSQSQAFLTPPQ